MLKLSNDFMPNGVDPFGTNNTQHTFQQFHLAFNDIMRC